MGTGLTLHKCVCMQKRYQSLTSSVFPLQNHAYGLFKIIRHMKQSFCNLNKPESWRPFIPVKILPTHPSTFLIQSLLSSYYRGENGSSSILKIQPTVLAIGMNGFMCALVQPCAYMGLKISCAKHNSFLLNPLCIGWSQQGKLLQHFLVQKCHISKAYVWECFLLKNTC